MVPHHVEYAHCIIAVAIKRHICLIYIIIFNNTIKGINSCIICFMTDLK